jgi:hypothetical protein
MRGVDNQQLAVDNQHKKKSGAMRRSKTMFLISVQPLRRPAECSQDRALAFRLLR